MPVEFGQKPVRLVPSMPVDHDVFIRAFCSPLAFSALAKEWDVQISSIRYVAGKMHLPGRPDARGLGFPNVLSEFQRACVAGEIKDRYVMVVKPKAPDNMPIPPAAPFWTAARDAAVLATQGRYREITALARTLGVPPQRVTGRWHLVRAI